MLVPYMTPCWGKLVPTESCPTSTIWLHLLYKGDDSQTLGPCFGAHFLSGEIASQAGKACIPLHTGCPTRKSDSVPFLPGSGPSIRLCMNERKTQVKTKGFYSKNAKYKKKIRSLFPCTVFHSDKTSRLHAAQTGSGRHIMPAGTAFLSMYSQQCPFPDRAQTHSSEQARGSPTEGTTAAVPPESLHPSKHCSPPPKGPQVKRKKNKRKQIMTIKP